MVRNWEMGIYASQSHCQLTSLTKQCPEQVQHEKRQPQNLVAQPHKWLTIMSNCPAKVKDISIKGPERGVNPIRRGLAAIAARRANLYPSQLYKSSGKNCRWQWNSTGILSRLHPDLYAG